jgi:polyhydroxybutyrate depolymerase
MKSLLLTVAVALQGQTSAPTPAPMPPADASNIVRKLDFDGAKRSYHFHLPRNYDPKTPTPVVVALHGAATNAKIMEYFCGLSNQADKSGFIVCYPNGTGTDPLLTWNAGRFPGTPPGTKAPDDISFLRKVLDDLETAANVDKKRVYVTGMSNGGMMAYRAAAEMSDRFAAMASVTGTLVIDEWKPKRPMPVLHIHGTKDGLVPWEGTKSNPFLKFPSIEEVVRICAKENGCDETPKVTMLPQPFDNLKVEKRDFGKGKNGAEVVLYVIEGGGHTWPGRTAPSLLGRSTFNLDTNQVLWDFCSRYRRE